MIVLAGTSSMPNDRAWRDTALRSWPAHEAAEPRREVERLAALVSSTLTDMSPDRMPPAESALLLADSAGEVARIWGWAGGVADWIAARGIGRGGSLVDVYAGFGGPRPAGRRDGRGDGEIADFVDGLSTRRTLIGDHHAVTAPLRQTSLNRTVGYLCHVTADAADRSWLDELALRVERSLFDLAVRSERLLMESFLAERRDGRRGVVALSDHVIITNAAAARLVGVEEQSLLWEHARRAVEQQDDTETTLEFGRGLCLQVHTRPVSDLDGETVGVVMRLHRLSGRVARPPAEASLPGLVGHGSKWLAMGRRLAAAGSVSTLLVGEQGVGKAAIAHAIAATEPVIEVDVAAIDAHDGGDPWCAAVLRAVRSSGGVLVVRHLESTRPEVAPALARTVVDAQQHARVIGTSVCWPGEDAEIDAVFDGFAAVVPVPPLRERTEDIPDLVRQLTDRFVTDHPQLDGVQWMTDALQMLVRLDWPGNVASLDSLVRRVLSNTRASYIAARDLPASVAARAARRSLAGLERVEAQAILQALQDADGNKVAAADALGIARSTLYRKMRKLGLNLSASTF